MGEIMNLEAERTASAIIEAGKAWENLKSAIVNAKSQPLTDLTVESLLADELGLSFPVIKVLVVAAMYGSAKSDKKFAGAA